MADIFVAPRKNKQKTKYAIEGSHMNVLGSFCQNPKGLSFQTQKEGESVILFLRSDFFSTNLTWIIPGIMLILLPPILSVFLANAHLSFFSSTEINRFTVVLVFFYYLIIFSYVFQSFLTWFYTVFIVTTERIIDIHYSDVVLHNMAETRLSHIEDVKYAQSGFIPSFLDYGNVFIQTAGTEENFEALSVPKPREITNIITNLIKK